MQKWKRLARREINQKHIFTCRVLGHLRGGLQDLRQMRQVGLAHKDIGQLRVRHGQQQPEVDALQVHHFLQEFEGNIREV